MGSQRICQVLLSVVLISSLTSCGEKSEDESSSTTPTSDDPNQVGTKYPLYVGALALGAGSTAAGSLTTVDNGFRNRTIASGTPQEFRMTVLSMRLVSETVTAGVPIFLSDEGKDLTLRSGFADLSDLFTKIECLDENNQIITLGEGETCECGLDANKKPIAKVTVDPNTGETFDTAQCPSVEPDMTPPVAASAIDQLGTFTKLHVRVKAKTKIRGCVTGHFQNSVSDTTDDSIHTFCTQTNKSPYAADADAFVNSDFESISDSKTAELMDFPFDSMSPTWSTNEFVDLVFPIAGGVVIDGITAPQITLAVDLGRALRYRGIFSANPRETGGYLTKGSYFFSLQPSSYQFVFVGKPGAIYAHEWLASAAVVDTAAEVPTNRECVAPEECFILAGWMTTIFQSDGTPISSSILPDDDDALTVLKGNNYGSGGFDSSVFSKNSDKNYNFDYSIRSTSNAPNLSGTFYGVDFSGAVGSTQVSSFATKTTTNGKFSYGKINLKRSL